MGFFFCFVFLHSSLRGEKPWKLLVVAWGYCGRLDMHTKAGLCSTRASESQGWKELCGDQTAHTVPRARRDLKVT